MMDGLGVLLMEEPDGNVGVQLFADQEKAANLFANLKGHVDDKPSRATFIRIDYKGKSSTIEVRDLPDLDDPEKRPDGYRLGEGPVWLQKEDKSGSE